MRVGVDRQKYSIQIPLPPKIDASVTMMTVEEKPDVTYRCGRTPGGSPALPACSGAVYTSYKARAPAMAEGI